MELFFHGVFRGLWVFACPRYSRKNGYFSTQEAPAARVVLTATTAVAQLLLRDTHYLFTAPIGDPAIIGFAIVDVKREEAPGALWATDVLVFGECFMADHRETAVCRGAKAIAPGVGEVPFLTYSAREGVYF
jgi:hypothetical protein